MFGLKLVFGVVHFGYVVRSAQESFVTWADAALPKAWEALECVKCVFAVALRAHLAFVQMQLVHVRFSDVVPLFTLLKYVLSVRFGAVAGVVCARVAVGVFGVFESVRGSDAAHEDGLHPA